MKNIVILCSPTSEDSRVMLTIGKKGYFFPPLGLLMVAQTIKNAGHEVRFYDGNHSINYKKDIFDYITKNQEKILFVGFYLTFLQINDFIDIVRAIKSINETIPIIIGGPLSAIFPKMAMKSGLVDVCCVGDGAKVARDLSNCLVHNNSFHLIPNITFIDDGKMTMNPRNQRDDLNEHNKIYYENFIDIESYVDMFGVYLTREYDSSMKRAIPILTGIGCSYECAFCENALLGHYHISLSAENIVDHIIYYHKKFNIDSFAFFDEDFFIDKGRLFKLLELLRKENLKIKWGTQLRANYFNERYINEKLLKKLEKAGCVRLCIGVESGSPRMLQKIKKRITVEQIMLATEYGKRSSIYFSYSFIINLPEETRKDLLMTYDLLNKLLLIKKNSFVSGIHYYIAYPGTPLSIEAEKKLGYKIEDEFNFEQLRNFSLKKYNGMINPQKKDMYRECLIFYLYRLTMPFQFKLDIKSIYYDIFKLIGVIRKKMNFYYLPIEIYLINWLKLIANKLKQQNEVTLLDDIIQH